jgi:RNA-binding protein
MYTHSGKQRRHLRGLAHPLKTVVQVGHRGVTEAVVAQVDAQLESHELIKVGLGRECPVDATEVTEVLAETLEAEVVQVVGRVLVVYRPHPEKPVIRLPVSAD